MPGEVEEEWERGAWFEHPQGALYRPRRRSEGSGKEER
jgi:hypothetical protein